MSHVAVGYGLQSVNLRAARTGTPIGQAPEAMHDNVEAAALRQSGAMAHAARCLLKLTPGYMPR
jgi:hypothetical protein